MDRHAREPAPETVECVVCSKAMMHNPGQPLDRTPLCSVECADKWDRGMEARDA